MRALIFIKLTDYVSKIFLSKKINAWMEEDVFKMGRDDTHFDKS